VNKRLITITSNPPIFFGVIPGSNGGYSSPRPEILISDQKNSGSGWDYIVDAQDVTGDGALGGTIQPGVLLPTAGYSGGTIAIRYVFPFPIASTQLVSIRNIQVTFTTGHIEVFNVPLVIFKHFSGAYNTKFMLDMPNLTLAGNTYGAGFNASSGYYSAHSQAAVDGMGVPINNFYSVTRQASFEKGGAPGSPLVNTPYHIFSKWGGINATTLGGINTNPSFTSSEQLVEIPAHPQSNLTTCFLDGTTMTSHNDRLAHMYGLNGLTTPDAFNSNRQEWHKIDFILQENNPQWHGDLETQNGTLMDLAGIKATMNANIGFMQGTYTPASFPQATYSPIDPLVEIGSRYITADIWDSLGDNVMTWSAAYELATRGLDGVGVNPHYYYTYKIFYAENLTAPVPPNPLHVFNVCDNFGDPLYYLTTSQDCTGATIPTDNLPGGVNHNITTFVPNNVCCSGCLLQVEAITQCVGFGRSDGYIEVTTTDPPWTSIVPTGDPFASGSKFTYTLALSNGTSLTQTTPPTGGNTVTQASCVTNTTGGTEHQVTCPSSSTIVPWMEVSGAGIPAGTYVDTILTGTAGTNVTRFSLQDAVGNTVQATAAATVTLTFAAGFRFYFGSLAPNEGALAGTHYILTVTDDSGCVITTNVTLTQCPPPDGCTDNTAINYDASAVNDDGSCLLCDATTGKLEDTNGNDLGDLFTNHTAVITDATVNASNVPQSDGIAAIGTILDPALQSYVSLGSTETYTMAIYPVTIPGDPTTIGSVISTQTGIASTTFSYNPQNSFTGLAYGHYAVKVQFVDSNHVLEVEECFTWIYITVKVPVCDDPLNPDYNTTVPSDFRIPDASLCSSVSNPNCPVAIPAIEISDDPNYNFCDCVPNCTNNLLNASLCNPTVWGAFMVGYGGAGCNGTGFAAGTFMTGADGGFRTQVWLFNGVPVANQFTQGAANDVSGYGLGVTGPESNGGQMGTNSLLIDSTSTSLMNQYGTGTYTFELHRLLADGTPCIYSVSIYWTQPSDGCLDPLALNYNPVAQCPGPCIFESYNCDPVLGCVDPGDGTGTYATVIDCQVNCLPSGSDGCTDSCAINYDPAATVDDGTCEYKACLDPAATNFEYSCDCGIYIPTATVSDPPCCNLPCADPPNILITTTDATGTCTGPNSDGQLTFTYNSTNGSTAFQAAIFTGVCCSSANQIWDHFAFYGTLALDGATVIVTGLPPGVYVLRTIDNLSCIVETTFSISSSAPGAGCTDPLAVNYDPTATCDDGSCIYGGCTDPNAANYNPNAITDDGSCEYINEKNRCIPKHLKKAILTLKACLAQKGSNWLDEYKIGTNVDCSTMNKWKLILLGYVLKAAKSENGFGLGCLFNCADKGTPDINTIINNCNDLWVQGSKYTGLNDAATSGSPVLGTSWTSGEGTTITDPALFFVASHKLGLGDVIKMPSGLIWKVISITTNQGSPFAFALNGLNPETATGIASGNYAQCSDNNFVDITTNINYYDNFLKFVNKYCKDCNIPPAWQQ